MSGKLRRQHSRLNKDDIILIRSFREISNNFFMKYYLWIRIGLNAGPDAAFLVNADPEADPDLGF